MGGSERQKVMQQKQCSIVTLSMTFTSFSLLSAPCNCTCSMSVVSRLCIYGFINGSGVGCHISFNTSHW